MRQPVAPRPALLRALLVAAWVAMGLAGSLMPAGAAPRAKPHAGAKVVAPAPAPVPAVPSLPPYEPQLLQLAELSGTIAYLRGLCHDADAPLWRERISALIQSTAKSPGQSGALVGAYNRGYGAYALTYHRCTANAHAIINRAMVKSRAIAEGISEDYGVTASD
ncbi:MAG: TIGR02301 family protein [Hyphomicrobiales bacterium]|nr:TIGR02301 family protein [Hyphomicrobiales bacterium]